MSTATGPAEEFTEAANVDNEDRLTFFVLHVFFLSSGDSNGDSNPLK